MGSLFSSHSLYMSLRLIMLDLRGGTRREPIMVRFFLGRVEGQCSGKGKKRFVSGFLRLHLDN